MLAMTILWYVYWKYSLAQWLSVFWVAVGVALKSAVCVVPSSKWKNQQCKEFLLPSVCFHFMFLQHTWGQSGFQHVAMATSHLNLLESSKMSAETMLSSSVPSDFCRCFVFWGMVPKHFDPPVRLKNPVHVFLLCKGDVRSVVETKPSWTSCCWVIKVLFSLPFSPLPSSHIPCLTDNVFCPSNRSLGSISNRHLKVGLLSLFRSSRYRMWSPG